MKTYTSLAQAISEIEYLKDQIEQLNSTLVAERKLRSDISLRLSNAFDSVDKIQECNYNMMNILSRVEKQLDPPLASNEREH